MKEEEESLQSKYEKYLRTNNINEDSSEIKNIMAHINSLEEVLKEEINKKEQRKREREQQAEEGRLRVQIDSLLADNISLRDIIEKEENCVDDTTKNYMKQQIEKNNQEIETKRREYLEIKSQNEQIRKRKSEHPEKIETQEEYKTRMQKIKKRITHFSVIETYLLEGYSWDDALSKFLEWQKERYRMDINDNKEIVEQDIKKMHEDEIIANEIIDVAMGENIKARNNGDER